MNAKTINETVRQASPQKSPGKAKNIVLWILQVLVALPSSARVSPSCPASQ
jgi:hypothetical protein